MIPAKIYPLTVPGGGTFVLPASGAMFKILSATGPVIVTGDTFGNLGQVDAGQGLTLPAQFGRLTLTDMTGADNALQVLVADAGFIDDRIAGIVETIDSAANRSLAKQAFGGFNSFTGAAGQYGYVCLANTGGKRVRVDRMIVNTSAASGINAAFYDHATNGLLFPGNSNPGGNKYAGGANSSAYVHAGSSAVDHLDPNRRALYTVSLANDAKDIEFRYPLYVPPGFTLLVRPSIQALNLAAFFEWIEERP